MIWDATKGRLKLGLLIPDSIIGRAIFTSLVTDMADCPDIDVRLIAFPFLLTATGSRC